MMLQPIIEHLYESELDRVDRDDALHAVQELIEHLNAGDIRAADCYGGIWRVNLWVKKGILVAFRLGVLTAYVPDSSAGQQYFDKDTMSLKKLSVQQNVRVVPGGSAVRDGAYVAPGVVIMPPSYVNIGAYIDSGTMVDSHALVGSCAQVGKRVHVSAGVQIGGVLEPIGSMPVIIEDDVMVGGNCGIYEGAIVKRRAVIGAGVIITGSTPVYDIVRNAVYRRAEGAPLTIPEGAVVVPGSRGVDAPFARENNLSLYAPIIVKYRDEKTDAATALEESLR